VTGPCYGLAVVATAMRDTAFEVSGVGCLGEDCVEGATRLEGASLLKVLALEEEVLVGEGV